MIKLITIDGNKACVNPEHIVAMEEWEEEHNVGERGEKYTRIAFVSGKVQDYEESLNKIYDMIGGWRAK